MNKKIKLGFVGLESYLGDPTMPRDGSGLAPLNGEVAFGADAFGADEDLECTDSASLFETNPDDRIIIPTARSEAIPVNPPDTIEIVPGSDFRSSVIGGKKVTEVETSLTLDYRAYWGLERIVLDGIANHLPADSGGKNVRIRFRQRGEYVDFRSYDNQEPVEEIVFEDDGEGYPALRLTVLRSTKGADALSVGQFGEGIKLISAACLREKIHVEYRSRNWHAVPFAKLEKDEGDWFQRLCFRITENGDTVKGSRTIFHEPRREMVEEVLKIATTVLAFNTTYRELHNVRDSIDPFCDSIMFKKAKDEYQSRIMDLGKEVSIYHQAIYVKGVKMIDVDALFSYDIGIDRVNPDRSHLIETDYGPIIKRLLINCANKDVIRKVLKAADDDNSSKILELKAFDTTFGRPVADQIRDQLSRQLSLRDHEVESHYVQQIKLFKHSLWVETFKELYGENAVISGVAADNSDATILRYKPVDIDHRVGRFLENNGVETAHDIAKSVTRDYRWVERDLLEVNERSTLSLLQRLTVLLVGQKPIDVRVYDGLYTSTGRELESAVGVRIKEIKEGQEPVNYIGLKRSILQDPHEAARWYTHELAHHETEHGDYTREHAQWGFDQAAKLGMVLLELLGQYSPKKEE